MLAGIDALIALERFGTVSEAAVRLRLTQSAVSKRIHALQDELGYAIVEPEGRKLRLTPSAIDFLQRAKPLLAELRGLKTPTAPGGVAHLSLAVADSIACSWGPRVLRQALDGSTGLDLALHSHRSVLVVESVRLGRYHLGLCTDPLAAMDLIHHPLAEEPMVLVNSGLARKANPSSPLITIEPAAAAWKAIEPALRAHHSRLLSRPLIPVESFGAAIQMARAGFGDGLVPLGLVLETRLDRRCYRELSAVVRPVALLARKTVNRLPSFALFRERLLESTRAYFATARAR